jgi:hypothetical protein
MGEGFLSQAIESVQNSWSPTTSHVSVGGDFVETSWIVLQRLGRMYGNLLELSATEAAGCKYASRQMLRKLSMTPDKRGSPN